MPSARHDDRQGKRQSAALGGSGDSFFPHHIKELKNSNYSVNSDALSVCWDRPGDAAVTTWKSQGLHVMAVDFLLIEGAVGGGSAPPPRPLEHRASKVTMAEREERRHINS